MSKSNANNPQVFSFQLGDMSVNDDVPLIYLPRSFVLHGARLTDMAGVAADNTDYLTATVKQGTTSLASYDTRAAGQGALVAMTSKALAVTDSSTELDPIPAGDVKVTLAFHGNATLTGGVLQLYGYWK